MAGGASGATGSRCGSARPDLASGRAAGEGWSGVRLGGGVRLRATVPVHAHRQHGRARQDVEQGQDGRETPPRPAEGQPGCRERESKHIQTAAAAQVVPSGRLRAGRTPECRAGTISQIRDRRHIQSPLRRAAGRGASRSGKVKDRCRDISSRQPRQARPRHVTAHDDGAALSLVRRSSKVLTCSILASASWSRPSRAAWTAERMSETMIAYPGPLVM